MYNKTVQDENISEKIEFFSRKFQKFLAYKCPFMTFFGIFWFLNGFLWKNYIIKDFFWAKWCKICPFKMKIFQKKIIFFSKIPIFGKSAIQLYFNELSRPFLSSGYVLWHTKSRRQPKVETKKSWRWAVRAICFSKVCAWRKIDKNPYFSDLANNFSKTNMPLQSTHMGLILVQRWKLFIIIIIQKYPSTFLPLKYGYLKLEIGNNTETALIQPVVHRMRPKSNDKLKIMLKLIFESFGPKNFFGLENSLKLSWTSC